MWRGCAFLPVCWSWRLECHVACEGKALERLATQAGAMPSPLATVRCCRGHQATGCVRVPRARRDRPSFFTSHRRSPDALDSKQRHLARKAVAVAGVLCRVVVWSEVKEEAGRSPAGGASADSNSPVDCLCLASARGSAPGHEHNTATWRSARARTNMWTRRDVTAPAARRRATPPEPPRPIRDRRGTHRSGRCCIALPSLPRRRRRWCRARPCRCGCGSAASA